MRIFFSFPVEYYLQEMNNSKESNVVISVNKLEKDLKCYSLESDLVQRVIDRSTRERFRRRRELERVQQRDCMYLVTVVLIMLTIAGVVITARLLVLGVPENKPRVPPYKPNNTEQQYQYVVDWNVDFPEAIAVERKIPRLKSSVYIKK